MQDQYLTPGDSGSPILSSSFGGGVANYYVGMLSYGSIDPSNPAANGLYGGGLMYTAMATGLKTDDNLGIGNLNSGVYTPVTQPGHQAGGHARWDTLPLLVLDRGAWGVPLFSLLRHQPIVLVLRL
jgi:hypothetical protein